MVVSDNGPQFVSNEFELFLRENGIKHIKCTPYHPRSNGLAERAVRTFKRRMEASKNQQTDLQWRAQNVLLSYRITPHRTTGRTPGEVMFGRRLLTSLDLMKPDMANQIDQKLTIQKLFHDKTSKWRSFEEGEEVWVANPLNKGTEKGVIEKKTGPVSYWVKVNGTTKKKHADQLRKT
ncbi:Hypothetical Protein NTJ_09253 [Nesidiocoris tenuis]|uniref:Integrase catalytic domain-containing protein n=1 Tax=Nesidiocoris tenuis TaxID=355587 RepID=A0ABN7AW77_9HEMI|nr:Hypothetical Protein NTJ_09253 [Nesidiocoris tenuis]